MNPEVSIGCYRDRRRSADPQARVVTVGPLTMWFSYETLVAFRVAGGRRVVRENSWGPTTGSHLNEIDGGDREGRVSGAVFASLWNGIVGPIFSPAETGERRVTREQRPDRAGP